MNKRIIFVLGGARSGKSVFAIQQASKISGKKAYIATAEALDEEMQQRIEEHKRQRGNDWITYEEPLKIAEVIKEIDDHYSVIVIDCITLWLSNLIHTELVTSDEINYLMDVLTGNKSKIEMDRPSPESPIFIVSNEVGMGIVPDNEIARRFRDMAGLLNQKIAEIADEVYITFSGIPVKVKYNNV